MKIEYKYRMAFGLVLLLLGIAIETIWKGAYGPITSALMAVGIVIIVGTAIRHYKYGQEEAEKDERTVKLAAFALANAWLATLVFLLFLFLVDYYKLIEMTAFDAIMLTLVATNIAAAICQWQFKRKGDVE
jgi:hypothetical protein